MDEDSLNDLKQFITATVSQQTSDIRDEIGSLDNKLSTKIDDYLIQLVMHYTPLTNLPTIS